MTKLLAIGALLALLGLGISSAWDAAYQSGIDAERSRRATAAAESRTAEQVEVREIIKWRDKERIIYRDRIQTIHTAADPTGCLDTDLRDAGLGFMLRAGKAPDNN